MREITLLMERLWVDGGKPNVLPVAPSMADHVRWIVSGSWKPKVRLAHRKQVRAARRRNRGRGSFAKFR